jgi:hypothetical protein
MTDGRDRANQPPSKADAAKAYLADLAKKKGLEYGVNYGVEQALGSNGEGAAGAGALGLYNGYEQYKQGNKEGAAISTAQGATGLAAGLGSTSAAQALPYAGAAVGAYNGYKTLSSDATPDQKATAMRDAGERTVEGIYSLGLSEAGRYADQKFLDGKIGKVREKVMGPGTGWADKGASKVIGAFNRGSSTHWEEKYRQELADKGVVIPNSGQKEWELNEKFKQSRNESDLTGRDIIHASKFYDIPGYDKLSPDKQEAIANEALKQGLIREHHGGIEVGMNEAYQKFIDTTLAGGGTAKPKQGNREEAHKQVAAPKKVQKKKPKVSLEEINPYLDAPATMAPRYDLQAIDYSSHYKNPYL